MLTKYSVLTMLLIVTASLVGISSSIYKPANVETQPQQPPQKQSPLTKGLVTQKQFESTAQALADKQLLDRLFPQIIKRIDGNTLLQKIDAKTLAAKVLPYLDLNIITVQRPGPTHKVDITGPFAGKTVLAQASCPPEESLVGGGLQLHNIEVLHSSQKSPRPDEPNTWSAIISFDRDGSVTTLAECLRAELVLKQEQQPQPSPSQPPGGPPLQPPSNP